MRILTLPKRFTDSDKWKKKWFRCMRNDFKVFWIYVLDQCNHAGIWEVDFELAWFFCRCPKDKVKSDSFNRWRHGIRAAFRKQYQEIDSGKRWFIKDFIEFQYGTLNENNRAHLSVINILLKYKLIENKGLISPLQGYKDKVKDKVKVKVKEKENKTEQIKKIESNFPALAAEFQLSDAQLKKEFDDWRDYMLSHGKQYKNYNATFRRWLRSDYVKKDSVTLKDIKTDVSGFYRGKCNKCGSTDSYDKSEIFQDSRCCKAEIHPIRNVPTNQKGVQPLYNLEGNDVLRRKDGRKSGAVYD
jgi:hypothetical protein